MSVAAGVDVRPAPVNVAQLLDADEAFVTNSAMGIMPVCRIERKAIGADRPGPLTRRLSDLYAAEVAKG